MFSKDDELTGVYYHILLVDAKQSSKNVGTHENFLSHSLKKTVKNEIRMSPGLFLNVLRFGSVFFLHPSGSGKLRFMVCWWA